MGVYKYDAINDELIPIAGVPSVPGIEDKVSTYTADATYWDTSPTSASNKPVTSGGVYTALGNKADVSALSDKLGTYASSPSAWDTTPTEASTKPVISDGIKTQFDKVNNELSDVNDILGSKNIIPNSATTQVISGVTYTVNTDGSINVNGTATADSILHIVPGTTGKLSVFFSKGGNYIISVGTTGAGVDAFFGIKYTGSTWNIGEWLKYSTYVSKEIYIDGTKLNNASSIIEFYIKVSSGTTVSNIKVYPMLRPANIKDTSYVPYAMTNRDLTTEISNLANSLVWKQWGSFSDASDHALPSTFKELHIKANMGTYIIFTLSILRDELPAINESVQNFRTGYMLDGSSGGAVVFEGNVSKIKCKQAQINGASVLPIGYRIWYR